MIMEWILLLIIFSYSFSFIYLSRKYSSTKINYVFGRILYGFFPEKLKEKVLIQDEERILKEMHSSYSYNEERDKYASEKVGSIFNLIFLAVLFTLIFAGDYIATKEIGNKIVKPLYEAGINKTRTDRIKYEIGSGGDKIEGFIDLQVDENMSEEEVVSLLETKYEELLEIVLGENKAKDEIRTNLNFDKRPFDRDIEVKYESSNRNVLKNDGSIVLENIELGEKYPVSVGVNMMYRDISLPFNMEFVVEREALSVAEEELILKERIVEEEGEIILPDNLKEGDAKIIWYKLGKGIVWYKIIAAFLIIAIAFYYLYKFTLESRLEERKRSIALDVPDLINKLILLIKAGFTPERAWLLICDDYEKNTSYKRPLFEEMLISKKEIVKGVNFDEILLNFGKRISNRELMAMVSLLIQNNKRGSTLLITALEQMGKEAWELRLKNAKTTGEKASTKLLIPLGISFLVLVLIVLAPVMMSINI